MEYTSICAIRMATYERIHSTRLVLQEASAVLAWLYLSLAVFLR